MKFSDFVAQKLRDFGIDFVAGVTGGGVVHLLRSMENFSDVSIVYTHHEQAAAYAAEAYARLDRKAACFVTTGPGGTNAITGLASAWLDSIPLVFISGQARSFSLTGPGTVRQIGSQHFDIISVVKPISKYAETIRNLQDAESIIDEALTAATSGRPGPVWIDIPLDFQEMDFFVPKNTSTRSNPSHKSRNELIPQELSELDDVVSALSAAERPIFVLGYGSRLSNTHKRLISIAERENIPMALTWNTLDLLGSDHHLNVGLIGVNGTRSGNLAVAKSDCVIAFGSHLSLQLTGPNVNQFAPKAKIFVIDIDPIEIQHLNSRITGLEFDLSSIMPALESGLRTDGVLEAWNREIEEIRNLRDYGLPFDDESESAYANQYIFYRLISQKIRPGDYVVIDGGGNVLFSTHQQIRLPSGTRAITGHGLGCMGSGLPHAVGAAFAGNLKNRIYCFIGDGSMQFNVQELATIKYHNLPITIFIINNDGYLAIINTQDSFFDRRFGVNSSTGLYFPNYGAVAAAYEIPYFSIENNQSIYEVLERSSAVSGPCVVEVFVDPDTPLLPAVGYKMLEGDKRVRRDIYDMDPLLPGELMKRILGH